MTIIYAIAVKILTSNNTRINGEKFDGRIFLLTWCLLVDILIICSLLNK